MAHNRDLMAGAVVFRVGLPGPLRATAGSGRLPTPQGLDGHDPSACAHPACWNVHNVRPLLRPPVCKLSRPIPHTTERRLPGGVRKGASRTPAGTVLVSRVVLTLLTGRTIQQAGVWQTWDPGHLHSNPSSASCYLSDLGKGCGLCASVSLSAQWR